MTRRIITKVVINEVPLNAEKFIVARLDNGALWYMDSSDDLDTANEIMDNYTNAIVVERDMYD